MADHSGSTRVHVRNVVGILRLLITAGTIAVCSITCRTGPPENGAPTQIDRLVRAYPELRNGRFVVIADFEDTAHMQLFRLNAQSERSTMQLDLRGGRRETGSACLRLRKVSRGDTLIINNSSAKDWYLKRDWHEYDLLVMSIHASHAGIAVGVTIATGVAETAASVASSISLHKGWNTIRLDLGELHERISLGDVRELRLRVSNCRKPVDLRLDDVLLTSSRVNLFGDPDNQDGQLYVQQVGRRWRIGAGGRFELTMAGGQFVQWYNLADDPHRIRNLLRGTTLGPSPIAPESHGEEDGFAALGSAVVVIPRIVELGAVRTVIVSEWRFVDDPENAFEDRPFQRWRYTIYPTGQMFVVIEATARTESWMPQRLDLVVSMAAASDDALQVFATASDDLDATNTAPYAYARSAAGNAALLFIPGGESRGSRIKTATDDQLHRATLTLVDERPLGPVRRWTAQLLLAASDIVSDDEAEARALAFSDPPSPRVDVGRLATEADGPWHPTTTGFDQATGSYVIVPDGRQARFMVGGSNQPFFSPTFTIVDSQNRNAWVYVDHIIHDRVERDTEGNLVFQLPGIVSKPRRIEVLFQGHPVSGS